MFLTTSFLLSFATTAALQDPAPSTQELTFYEQLCQKRKQASCPKRGPSEHFRSTGDITFIFPSGETVEQECEVLVGGPSRLRYLLKKNGKRNLFLVQTPKLAWFLPNAAPSFQKWDAEELSRQTWLRWVASRFPWDFKDTLAGNAELKEFKVSGPWGTLDISLGDDFLPNRLSLRTMDLRLSDWAPGSKGRLFPKRWEWKTPALTQVEIFPVIEDGVLVFDKAFGPFSEADSSQDAIGNWVGNSSKDSKQRIKGEEYGLQIRPPIQLWAAEQDSTWWKSLPSEEKKQSWVVLLENEGQLVGLSELTGKPPEGVQVQSFSEGLWLRWVTYTQLGAQQLADELRESAIKSKLIPLGPALFRGPNAENRIGRRELLLSVKKQN